MCVCVCVTHALMNIHEQANLTGALDLTTELNLGGEKEGGREGGRGGESKAEERGGKD